MIAARRLHNQRIARPLTAGPVELIEWMGAVQAQEYRHATWGLALRLRRRYSDEEIDRAFDHGQLLRTHVMRPTWHFVPAEDIRWMLELTGPRVQRAAASYYRNRGLETRVLVRAAALFERALAGGTCLTRAELGGHLARRGIRADALQLALLTLYAELEGIVCSGPRRGKHFTYALLAERAPQARSLTRDEAVAELTRRYFRSHGPATIRDFVWWSGLTSVDARHGLEAIGASSESAGGLTYWTAGQITVAPLPRPAVHLLPIYDEYLVSYRDRSAVPHGPGASGRTRSGVFQHALVIDGQVAGTWLNRRAFSRLKAEATHSAHTVEVVPLRRLSAGERRALALAAEPYARFLRAPVKVAIAG